MVVFLSLTMILSVVFYILIIQVGTINGGRSTYASLLMLAPGMAAILTYLSFERSLRPVSWQPGKVSSLLGLVIPLLYCLINYGLVWLTGRGRFNGQLPPNFAFFLVAILFSGTISALLEEIAWRGFALPHMQSRYGPLKASRLIKSKWPQIKIIILSVFMDYQPRALAAGADEFISKSDPPETLRKLLAELLQKSTTGKTQTSGS